MQNFQFVELNSCLLHLFSALIISENGMKSKRMFALVRRKQQICALYPHGESEGLYGAFGNWERRHPK